MLILIFWLSGCFETGNPGSKTVQVTEQKLPELTVVTYI